MMKASIHHTRILWVVLLLLWMAFLVLQVAAQVDTGVIAGTVVDTSGAVVPEASVTAKNLATGVERTVQTNSSGQYSIPALPPGQYEVSVKSAHFGEYRARATVTVGGHLTLDATLAVSKAETVVEVVGEGGTQVNTQTYELSQIITPQEIAQLPSLTRNPYDFVAVAGNVSSGDRTTGDQNTTGRGVGYAINGQRTSGTEILLDGVENIDLFTDTVGQSIPIDGVQEFRVITTNFDAQYGRASGGVVNVSTKSGTNAIHGSVWEFNRLAAYTANTYDNDSKDLPKGQYTRNQFGYTVGAPIIKDKLFIFQTTEWTKVRSNASLSAYVPTPQLLALTAPNTQAYFNAYGANSFSFANTLSVAQVTADVGSKGAFSQLPASTPAFGLLNFNAPADAGGGVPTNTYRILGRLDFNMTDKTQMFFRYALENVDNFIGADFASPYSQYNVGDAQYNQSALFSLSHTFSNSLLANVKVSYSRVNIVNTYDQAQGNVPELLLNSAPVTLGTAPVFLPGLFAQFAGAGGLPFGGPQNVIQITPTVAKTKGRHSLMFGGLFDYQQINKAFGAYAQGLEQTGKNSGQGVDNLVLGQLALFQAAVYPQGKFPCVRDPNTNALIQTPDCTLTLPAGSPSFKRNFRYNDWAIFAQDSFRATPRLTLSLGLRYEHYGVQHNSDPNLDSNFYFGSGSNIYEQIRNGSVQLAPNSPVGGMWNPRWGTVAPRVGFAMDLTGDGKTSLRGGFGISYERNFGNVTFNVIQNPPNYASVQLTPANLGVPIPITNDNLGPFSGANGSVPLSPSSLRHVSQDIQVAQTQFWSLAIERELARQTVFAVEYAGAHGVHLYDISSFNPLGGGQEYLGDPFNGIFTRTNQQYTGINTRGSNGGSHYNALNLRFQSSNLHHTGLNLVANYTWSHSLDDLSSTFSDSLQGASNGIGNLGYLDPRNPGLDWGSSDYDIRHRFSVTPLWQTPWFSSGKGWQRQVLGGWTLVPVFSIRSGVPFSVYDSTNSLNFGTPGWPRYEPSTPIGSYATGSAVAVGPNVFNLLTLPAAASENPFDPVLGISDFGPFPADMTHRNTFRGPGAWTFDFAVTKSFKLTERMGLEFRAEGFDIFNHHNYYVNGSNLDVPNFAGGIPIVQAAKGGLGIAAIGGNHDERRFGQFALRLTF